MISVNSVITQPLEIDVIRRIDSSSRNTVGSVVGTLFIRKLDSRTRMWVSRFIDLF